MMAIPVTATKTFSEWLTENPNFYDDRLEAGVIDEATVDAISDWFTFRTICDDTRFNVYYGRQLDLILPRYNKLVRIENTEFDAMVNTYRELQILDNGSETGTELIDKARNNSKVDSYSGSKVRTPDLTTTDNGSSSSTAETDSSNENASSSSTTSHDGSRAVAKQNPQSISYEESTINEIPGLNWSYPSTQQQSDGDNTTSNSSESEGTGHSDTVQSDTNSNTNRQTGTETTSDLNTRNITGNETESGTKGTEKVKSGIIRSQWTGRDGLTPQAALSDAMKYIKNSSSFKWLKEQLEVCFLSVYDI